MSISVVIPAYNEEAVIERLLDALAEDDADNTRLDIVVVCNGCTDNTEEVARRHPVATKVLSTPTGSKHLALSLGDEVAEGFPRFYVDADVVVTGAALRRMAAQLGDGCHAVAPARDLRLNRSARVVRAYYAVWQQLPSVRSGLFGRGVIGVDEQGFLRITPRPDVLGDDLVLDLAFDPRERCVDAGVSARIEAPRTLTDLLRRRVRAHQGNRQVDASAARGIRQRGGAGMQDVLAAVRRRTVSPLQATAFLLVTATARAMVSRRRDAGEWLRDESSRAA